MPSEDAKRERETDLRLGVALPFLPCKPRHHLLELRKVDHTILVQIVRGEGQAHLLEVLQRKVEAGLLWCARDKLG